MAASDYIVSGDGGFCPSAVLSINLAPLGDAIFVTGFEGVTGDDLEVGMALMIDNEILRLESTTLPSLSVLRGCADTIPALHLDGATVWFFSEAAAGDEREYLATDVIGVKISPFTASSGPMPIEFAPPMTVTFDWRAFRPYPPANLLVDGQPWFNGPFDFASGETTLVLTWHHRDRVGQGDLLIAHGDASFGPEEGTSYRVKVYNADNVLVRTVSDIAAVTSWAYPKSFRDLDIPSGTGRLAFCSVRDDFESLQQYQIIVAGLGGGGGTFGGLGDTLGENLGGGGSGAAGGLGDTLGENLGGSV